MMLLCICEKCSRPFELIGDDYGPKIQTEPPKSTLDIRSCDSGGIYAIEIECPRCKHTHQLR